MRIHREGAKLLIVLFIVLFGAVSCLYLFFAGLWLLHTISLLFAFILFLLVLQFFRNPVRKTPLNPKYVIAPADGKVVVIEEVFDSEYFNDRRKQVSIFMSPVNVHVNRHPISGKVKYFKYHSGKYLVAWHPKSSLENERTTVVTESEDCRFRVMFRQIAGALARRIVCYVKEGSAAVQGEEFGFIKFGSRVDVLLPLEAEIKVKLGDKTRGGETVLAELS